MDTVRKYTKTFVKTFMLSSLDLANFQVLSSRGPLTKFRRECVLHEA